MHWTPAQLRDIWQLAVYKYFRRKGLGHSDAKTRQAQYVAKQPDPAAAEVTGLRLMAKYCWLAEQGDDAAKKPVGKQCEALLGVEWSKGMKDALREYPGLWQDWKDDDTAPSAPSAKKVITDFPHKCPVCTGPAYIGFAVVECSKGCKL